MEHMKNDYKINRPQNQSDVSEPLAQVSMQQLVKKSNCDTCWINSNGLPELSLPPNRIRL